MPQANKRPMRRLLENRQSVLALLSVFFAFFLLLGLCFSIGGGVWLHHEKQLTQTAQQVSGTVSGFVYDGDEWCPLVIYNVDSKSYTQRLQIQSKSMRVGDTIPLYYLPESPQQARPSSSVGGRTLIGVGAAFSAVGLVGLSVILAARRKRRLLKQNGVMLRARVIAVRKRTMWTLTGKRLYRISCVGRAAPDQPVHRFKVNALYRTNPQAYVGKSVNVYVHAQRWKNYYVDLQQIFDA